MSQPVGHQAFLGALGRRQRAPQFDPQANQEPSPLQRAFDDYHRMEAELRATAEKNQQLLVQNMNLVSEVSMLREAYERADGDRIRLQAISSTLLGRLLAINDAIGGAVRASIKDGIDAVHTAKAEDELEQAGADAQDILQRVQPVRAPEPPAERRTHPEPLQVRGATIPSVDWSRQPLPRN
jgi:hypothetical protein